MNNDFLSKCAFITPIEMNKSVEMTNGQMHMRFYEDELIRCIKSIRQNGGWMKDIKIYVLNFGDYPIKNNPEMIELFDKYDIEYIVEDIDTTTYSKCGFIKEPLCGKWFEEANIPEEYLIKIDMDMCLLKPIPEDLIRATDNHVLIGQYDEESAKEQRKTTGFLPLDTNFIIENKKHKFYTKTIELLLQEKDSDDYFVEERIADIIYNEKIIPIKTIQKYQYGEGYTSVMHMEKEEVKNILFSHEHISKDGKYLYGYSPVKEKLAYARMSR